MTKANDIFTQTIDTSLYPSREQLQLLLQDVINASKLNSTRDTTVTAYGSKYERINIDHQGTLFTYRTAVKNIKRLTIRLANPNYYQTDEDRQRATEFKQFLQELINSYDRTIGQSETKWYAKNGNHWEGPYLTEARANRELARLNAKGTKNGKH